MKKKDLKEARSKSTKELNELIKKTQAELVKAKNEFEAGKIKTRRVVSQKRRDLAQMKTILSLSEKGLLEANRKEGAQRD